MGSWAGIWMSATSLLTGYLLQAGFTQQSPAPLLDLPAPQMQRIKLVHQVNILIVHTIRFPISG